MADDKSEKGTKASGRFGYTPMPSELNVPVHTTDSDSSTSSPLDVFGLVLLLGAVRPIWQLKSLFCYRGLWHDDRVEMAPQERQEVVLTIATGNSTASDVTGRSDDDSQAAPGVEDVPTHLYSHPSLLYLHTGTPMQGVAHPIIWKSSPSKSEIAIISKSHEGEKSLTEVFRLGNNRRALYIRPSTADLCHLTIKIVQILEEVHAKRVRHGNLRPDVIGFWASGREINVCIRDFAESRLFGESDSPVNMTPSGDYFSMSVPPSICLHYTAPETIGGGQPGIPLQIGLKSS
jgi:hypothetical protein